MFCSKCSTEILESERDCSTCGRFAGFPNVRAAEKVEEVQALESRYSKAIQDAQANGSDVSVTSFEENVKKSCAVINVNLQFLHQFVTQDGIIYGSYSLAVRGQIRKPAAGENDRKRLAVEAILFGSYAEEVRYAALSLDGVGLASYGPYTIKLKELAIDERASLLEDNSYVFVERHKLYPGSDIPQGYRSGWTTRHKLAVAKLAGRISVTTTEAEHAELLLSGSGGRATDEFMEVLIYGRLDNKTIEEVRGSSAVKGSDRVLLNKVKERLKKTGKRWIES